MKPFNAQPSLSQALFTELLIGLNLVAHYTQCCSPVRCCCLDNNHLFMSISCWGGGHYWGPISQFTWLCEMRLVKAGRDQPSVGPGAEGGGGGRHRRRREGRRIISPGRGFNTKIICNHRELELKIRRNGFSRDFVYHYLERLQNLLGGEQNISLGQYSPLA